MKSEHRIHPTFNLSSPRPDQVRPIEKMVLNMIGKCTSGVP